MALDKILREAILCFFKMDIIFFSKFFIYASASYGVFSANKYLFSFISALAPHFKHKEIALGGIEIISLIFFWFILLKSLNQFDWA